jgi:ribosomal protein S18 acetylase RimI-like enzyme
MAQSTLSARPTDINIAQERPDTADAITLITELEGVLAPQYPPESRHGLSVERLLAEAVAFFLLRAQGTPAACGGIKLFGTEYGELKRMYVRPQFRGLGFGKLLISHLAAYACAQRVALLRLETGIHQHEAIGLYERMGFQRIAPFGAYRTDPLSLFYEKRIACEEHSTIV